MGPLRRLTPAQYAASVADLFPGVALPEVALPEDPEVDGFDNNGAAQEPSPLAVAAWQEAAIQVAEAVVVDGSALGCEADGGADPAACGHRFIDTTATRAFRRPLDDAHASTLRGFFDALLAEEGFAVATTLTLEAILQSPEFLYLPEVGGVPVDGRALLDGYEVGARLALFVWGSVPDDALLAAAATGRLETADGVEAEARRMLADPRAAAGIGDFHRLWLNLDDIENVAPEESVYLAWRNSTPASMREEIDRMVLRVVLEDQGTLADLLTTRTTEADDDLALLYDLNTGSNGWVEVELDAAERAGVLTTPGWLAATSHAVNPSPVKRGVFVLTRLLCQPVESPPASADTTPPEEDTGAEPATNRERYGAHVADPTCAGCHTALDGIGFGFEGYDAVGAWRETDNGLPVDVSGELVGTDVDGPFLGAPELMERLATSDQVHRCVADHWLRFALGRTPGELDTCEVERLGGDFAADGRIEELLVAVVRSELFRYRAAL
jgi:hypothetical protein